MLGIVVRPHRTTRGEELVPSQQRRLCEWQCVYGKYSLYICYCGAPTPLFTGRAAGAIAAAAPAWKKMNGKKTINACYCGAPTPLFTRRAAGTIAAATPV